MAKKLLITIDTEADNQWDVSNGISTENTLFLPRFQELAENYGFVPTWLTNWEMCQDDRFVRYMKPKNDSGKCEIGMHLHAWNNPPEFPLEEKTDQRAYLIEYPEEQMEAKFDTLLESLRNRFEAPVTSHRSGRWALDERYAALLAKKGFIVDCSVTPHMDWTMAPGQTGLPGSDYSQSPEHPFELYSGLLEVPMTIRRTHRFAFDALLEPKDVLRQGKRLVKGQWQWLRPPKNPSASALRGLLDDVDSSADTYAMFMIHSSELMPGGSPNFPDENSVDDLFGVIEKAFSHAAELGFKGQGLTAFAKDYYICRRTD
ncbi:deacetylase [Collinsella sp. AF16-8]|uniref:deacetylase n=1 Tax=Collinsella sp. AF16-8 TaxID=2292215 RepID=UPI000E4A9024|nr:deacetylase [Collinsella sp. AF16-8]RGU41953.1 deacetylase [Collinsella sp. AF16-8]